MTSPRLEMRWNALEDDVGLRQVGFDGRPAGSTPVNAHRGDTGFLHGAELGKEAIQRRLAAPLGQPEQLAGAGVRARG